MKLINQLFLFLCLSQAIVPCIEAKENPTTCQLTLQQLESCIMDERQPLLMLFEKWKNAVSIDSSYSKFHKLCAAMGIRTRLANVQNKKVYDFEIDNEWNYFDTENQQFYLKLDNERLASSEEVMDDPFLLLRTKHPRYSNEAKLADAWKQFAAFNITAPTNEIMIPAVPTKKTQHFVCSCINSEVNADLKIKVCNSEAKFDYTHPVFSIQANSDRVEKIWWQISSHDQFDMIPSNLDQIEPYKNEITLSRLDETFLTPGVLYYFRIKGSSGEEWGEWSKPFAFVVEKPLAPIGIEFEKVGPQSFEINWERYAEDSEEPIEYLVYGSNSLDFIPTIYTETQVNEIKEDKIVSDEINDTYLFSTTEKKIIVSGYLAYYRIIAKKKGQFSVPSSIIRVYDESLVQPRTALQLVKEDGHSVAKRILLPTYSWTRPLLPKPSVPRRIIDLHSVLRAKKIARTYSYEPPISNEEAWTAVQPHLLPENHPAWPQLNRIFCKARVTQSPEEFRKAGFRRYRPGTVSRVNASSHPEIPEYFIKAYCDSERGIIYDWKKWLHRIKGAEAVRDCIKEYELEEGFKVPKKWIYPMPQNPSPPKSSRYVRKDFALVCENMDILDHKENEKMYKKITRKMMKGLYIVMQVCGLYDSTYIFNVPFCTDGRIAVIDTEYCYKWPVPYYKLNRVFSSDAKRYWEKLTYKGGNIPDGVSQYNPPRMDRRDAPPPRKK